MGYQWYKIKILNNLNIQMHGLTPNDTVLVLSSIYIDICLLEEYQVNKGQSILEVEIPVHKDKFNELDSLRKYFGNHHLVAVQNHQGFAIRDEILYKFIEEYFCTYGPFAVFMEDIMNKEMTWYIFDIQLYYNKIGEITQEVEECLWDIVNLLKEQGNVKLSIPSISWKIFISSIPKTEKYEQLEGIPKIPCFAMLNDGRRGIIESYNIKNEEWRIITTDGNRYNLQSDRFNIIEDDRVLPAECIIYPC